MEKQLTKEEFNEKSKDINVYRILKPIPPPLDYAKKGDRYHAQTLYERGYNIVKLIEDKFIELANEPFPFQKELVGKNIHSVYSKCPECGSFGINMPLDNICGNCNYPRCITYYDAETIYQYLQTIS